MRLTPRTVLAGLAGGSAVALTLALTSLSAQGVDNSRVVGASGSSELTRLAADGTYQLSVDSGRTWTRSRQQATQIKLRNRSFDPKEDVASLRTQTGAYLVQFAAAPLDSQRRELQRLGARVGAYIPDFAYVVRMDSATADKVAGKSYVRAVTTYEPADKYEATTGTKRYAITLVEKNGNDQRTVAERVTALGGTVHVLSASKQLLEATLTPAQLGSLAQHDAVLAMDETSAPQTDMDKAREDGGANAIETARGYKGQGVRGEVMDGGLRVTHQEFSAKPPIVHGGNSTDTSHGTSTYGQIFASGVTPAARGLLPEAQGFIAAYGSVTDRYAHTAQLVDPAGNYRAVFQSNSWGDALTTSYTSISAAMDDIVFDHDLLICQSQSNAGTRQSRPQAWSKNVVSVGGQYHKDTLSRTDDAWNSGASIGPAADGRIKPDLSNYYDSIYTTSSSSNTSYTSGFGGTSGATPITCGNFGLLFQMWADGVFAGAPGQNRDVFTSRPHAATAKALMINQANSYAFSGESHDLTRVHQGWGTASVGNLYNQAQANGWRLPILVNESDLLTTGTKKTYTITTDGTQPLKATMVYTDPQGSPTAAQARVNDLTLKVTAPNGTVYWGNNGLKAGNWSTAGGTSNTVDTVENVLVQNPAAGTWTIEVIADEVNQDGHPETPGVDADYALVVTAKTGPAPTGTPTVTPTGTPTATPTVTPSCGPKKVTNINDVTISDNSTVESSIAVTGVCGNAPATLKVDVDIKHTWRGDLVISLVAPDGTVYLLEDIANNDSADNVIKTYTVNASSEVANGTWKLRVQDVASQDVGKIDSWSLNF
ncbi:proprotein convertase P-domain-containing protein [Longispora albida]|uniref:proprotein convertase P-domain-containing protein n=1 Tax=Longispora albida TaxID=203523 RepID=UPI0003722319|nr:proprotein convertase P-domain-containing protein [Longispora albida]